MISNYLVAQITENFPFTPTKEQDKTIKSLSDFILSEKERGAFVLCGYAGTGKTTLIGALVKTMQARELRSMLMAPTGRAAKVFSNYSGYPAYTIHKRIYRQKSILNRFAFTLNDNTHKHTLFLVDEASMISNDGLSGNFGSGRLLDDLIEYVYSGEGCRLLLLGDTAQLPPVGNVESPALSLASLQRYGLSVVRSELTQVMRQGETSGILYNATEIRRMISAGKTDGTPPILFDGFKDIFNLSGEELIERIAGCYERDGVGETVVICRSNKRANIYNNGIRGRILYREDELNTGDYLMIVKNNYYWAEQAAKENKEVAEIMSFVANGDVAVVRRVKREHNLYGFRFVEVELVFPDYDDMELETMVLMDTLQSESPSLTKEQSDRLFEAVMQDYAEIPQKRDRMKRLRENPYFNALQVKYAYAVTCHKAQGGQWSNVFVDRGFLPSEAVNAEYFRWLYTALTRAEKRLYLVNWNDKKSVC